ncbi:MAG: LamG-like jellyroll fold domain-containing protein, partial [Methylococcaceae bacterium]
STMDGPVATLNISTPGVHTINVWMREDGFVFDKVVVTTDANYTPSGTGPAESLQSNELPTVETPAIGPAGGLFANPVMVSLTSGTAGAMIYYTVDGSDPTTASTLYSTPFELSNSATVKAVGFLSGYNDSFIALENYVVMITPSGLENYWQLDESNSSTYQDLISMTDATCTDCPASVVGLVNGAQQFNGATNELNVASNSSLDFAVDGRFSIEFWIKKDTACVAGEAVIGRYDTATQLNWWVGCESGNPVFYLFDKSGSGQALIGTSILDDAQWHHIVAIRDGITGENRLYFDGMLEASSAVSYTNGFDSFTADLNIGWLNDGNMDYHFAGIIDEVAIHDRVMTVDEVQRHYNDGTVGLRRGYWGCESPIRMLPLGDSNTNAANGRKSYRPRLYFDLVGAGFDVDFVGSRLDPSGSHDKDHEGWSGYTPSNIAVNLNSWLSLSPNDVIMLHIGTNDLSVVDVEDILNVVDAYDPNITVVLARIINRATYHQPTTDFNIALEIMAQSRIINGDKIVVVDMEPALIYPDDMVDELHAAETGYNKMASVWLDGLNTFLPACVSTAPEITSTPVTQVVINTSYSYDVDVNSYPLPDYFLLDSPTGMTIHPDTGQLTWLPTLTGQHSVVIEATNVMGSTTQSFVVDVTN